MFRFIQRVTVGAVAVGAGAYACSFVVRPGEAAVVYNKFTGLKDIAYGEGLHMRILGLDDVRYFDVRVQPRVLQTMTGTKDLQMVNIRLRVLFRPDAERLPKLFRTFGADYDERILPSVSNEILKAVVAEYKAEELIQKREAVSARIFSLVHEKISQFGLVLEDLSLVDIQFGREFMVAVEQKQVAQQEAEKYKFVVLEAEQRRQAAIVRAEGEAEAARLISDAARAAGGGLVDLRRIEAAAEIAQELANAPNVKFVPQSVLLSLNGAFAK